MRDLRDAHSSGVRASSRQPPLPLGSNPTSHAALHCAEATNSRVAWFNILAAILVCTFCGWQLWYLNKASVAYLICIASSWSGT